MKLLDLFSGIGGFSRAFKKVFSNGEIIGFSEIDKYAAQIYEKHFAGVKNYGDVSGIKTDELPDFDCCTFGFPCQDLSNNGKRAGLNGKRSSLFYEAIRIINAKRPEYFIFENVKGLFTSQKGEDFYTVLQSIADIGYDAVWSLVNTKWVLPQNRERVFLVGFLREKPAPQIFPLKESNKENNVLRGEAVNTITARYHAGQATGSYIVKCLQSESIRFLTPLELERLQGFLDNWTAGISDTQRYKCLGNAITVNIAELIFKKLKESAGE